MIIKVEWDMSEVNALMEKVIAAGQSGTQALVHGGVVVEAHAKMNAEGHGLHKTGDLIGSIQVYDKAAWSVMVGSRGVVYAAIHEFGGEILPKRAKALSWIGEDGKRIFAKSVRMPTRAYLRPAFDENKGEIIDAIGREVAKQLGG